MYRDRKRRVEARKDDQGAGEHRVAMHKQGADILLRGTWWAPELALTTEPTSGPKDWSSFWV